MDNAVFMGSYEALPSAESYGLETSPSGYWQVWKMSNGEFMVQPVDANGAGSGALDLVPESVFRAVFQGVQQPQGGHGVRQGPDVLKCGDAVDANASNLLHFWYDARLQRDRRASVPLERKALHQEAASTVLPVAISASFEEIPAAPARIALQQYAAAAARLHLDDAAPQESVPNTALEDAMPSEGTSQSVFSSPAASQPTDSEEHFPSVEEDYAKAAEQVLRSEFELLIGQLRGGATQFALEGLEGLLCRPWPFTARQKYLFSELGLALRREKQYSLALMCHLRALEAAPEDEHVLFNLARTEYELGHVATAKEYLNKALAISPDFQSARTFMAFLDM